MLSVEKLNEFGADTISGIKRCANNEELYLRLVKMVPSNKGFSDLYEAIKNNSLDEAFLAAHGLKGILANLSLDPILNPIKEITELLRNKENIDYSKYLLIIEEKRKLLEEML
ncbi:MAG: hypothetical protein IJU60_00890 [Acholeplasmatales bacterium]|nr:hypothetical protein [Acholeplasmatales bacterium]